MHIIPLTLFAIILLCVGLLIPKEKVPPPPPRTYTDAELIAMMVAGNYRAALMFFGGSMRIVKVLAKTASHRNHPQHDAGIRLKQGCVVESLYEDYPLEMTVRWSEKLSKPDINADNEFYYCFIDDEPSYNDDAYELSLGSISEMSIAPIRMKDAEAYLQKRHEIHNYLCM